MFQLLAFIAIGVAFAQDPVLCPNGYNKPMLCGSESIFVNITQCNASSTSFPEMPPCCPLHYRQDPLCNDPNADLACPPIEYGCRSQGFDLAICPTDDRNFCNLQCFEKDLSIELFFSWDNSTQDCCKSCQCYGDPHCEAFDGTPDTWIICDARKPLANPHVCGMDKSICLSQTDHQGNPCKWVMGAGQKNTWNIALQGSPCRPADLTVSPPQMNMYSADDFSVILDMGERSIIQAIHITDGTEHYDMTADDCQSKFSNPWTDQGQPNNDPNWAPNDPINGGFAWETLSGGDFYWYLTKLKAEIKINIRCTRTVITCPNGQNPQGGCHGEWRLNVEINEQLDYVSQRKNVTGFCPNGTIAKSGSYDHTNAILKAGNCEALASTDLQIAQGICGAGTTLPGIADCQTKWCKEFHQTDAANLPTCDQGCKQCLSNIQTVGWQETFCMQKLKPSGVLVKGDCQSAAYKSGCQQCLNEVADNGWEAVYNAYKAPPVVSDGECIASTSDERLQKQLIGCERGVKIQYLKDCEWITSFVILETQTLCNNKISIAQQQFPELFAYPMRVSQCNLGIESGCVPDDCTTTPGFSIDVQVKVSETYLANIFDLFQSGDLICNPARWPNGPLSCLGFQPPPYCPCPTNAPGVGGRRLQGTFPTLH